MAYKNGYVITGSIGSGKSSVSKILRDLGYQIIDADEISHQLLDKSRIDISKIFGNEYIIKDGKSVRICRKKLGDLVFNDKAELAKLEAILHPKIKDEILRQSEILEHLNKPFFADIPLYFERQKYDEFDKIVVVYAPHDLLIERIMERNALTREQAELRVSLQADIEFKRANANFVIENVSDKITLEKNVKKFLKEIN
ncbi:dephospho-CoA kinase [Campylobacter sp. JMF_02 ED1]|uniref:dephospho-CoA kinase n=1 Tax=unclassified Campylobacter TaxID=2593542 RepID=UPI0022E9A96F|nr:MULTISPECIES: dephospho-CoA kinase [unclassified Campylobacter]MDA3049890.1 dephospho-CoA kinase [Campylobacter sp. JMF_15 NE4]MDA3050848.1 dephospho-CoA kinase [Campylobacter sp. JMF_02 ED1]